MGVKDRIGNFAFNIEKLITHYGFTKLAICKSMKLSPITLDNWIRDKLFPSQQQLLDLVKFFKYKSVDQLLLHPKDFKLPPEEFNFDVATRKVGRYRKCLRCDKLIHSRSAKHRLCKSCKATNRLYDKPHERGKRIC